MFRRADVYLPLDVDVWGVVAARGTITLRALCRCFWPHLRWRPRRPTDDSITEGVLDHGGRTRALWVWEALGRLIVHGSLRVSGRDQEEVDDLASVTIQILES